MKLFPIKLLILLLGVFLLPASTEAGAETWDLEQILEWGLENAPAQIDLRQELVRGEREIERIQALTGWQAGVQAIRYIDPEDREVEYQTLGFNLGRTFLPGIDLGSSISYGKTMWQDEFQTRARLSLGYQVLPFTPSPAQRELLRQEKNLAQLINTLELRQNNNFLDWVESYLELGRMMENIEQARVNLERVQEELDEVLRREQIGEAGELEVLDSRLALIRAENSLRELKQARQIGLREFYQLLGLPEDIAIDLKPAPALLQSLEQWVEELDLLGLEQEEMLEIARQKSPEIGNLKLDQKHIEQQIDWFARDRWPDLNLTGTVGGWEEDWEFQVNINLSYSIFDGGQQRLQREELADQKDGLERTLSDLQAETETRLLGLLNSLQSRQAAVQEKDLALQRAELETAMAAERLEQGLITSRTYNQALQNQQQAVLDYGQAREELLFARMHLAYFLGYFWDWEKEVRL